MTPREIVAEAWAITTRERPLWRWGFIESFFATLLNLKLLGYQAYFLYAYFNGQEVGFFDDGIWLYNNLPFWLFFTIVGTFVLLLIVEFFTPHLTMGAVVGLAAKSYRGEPVKGGLVLAIYNFFPIFGFHELFVLSSWSLALTACSVVLRYVDGSIKFAMVIGLVIIWLISGLIKFFAGFGEQAIVLEKSGVFAAISRSYKLMLSHMGQIMFLLVLLLVISLRVIINTVVIFLIPAAAIGLGILLTYIFDPLISYLIAAGISLVLIVIASYFLSYLHVFRKTVWTLTFIELSKHKELDVFE